MTMEVIWLLSMRLVSGRAGISKPSFLGVPEAVAEKGPVPWRLPAFTATS